MSRLDELIKELCPDGVEYKKLGEIAIFKTGRKPTKIYEDAGEYEYINAGTTNSGYTNTYNLKDSALHQKQNLLL